MTDQELRDLVASLSSKTAEIAEAQKETDRLLKESSEEFRRELQESSRKAEQRAEEFRRERQESDRRAEQRAEEFRLERQETDREQRETARIVREVTRQIGGLDNKFGSFTEGMALPSMTKILTQRFQMDFIAPRARARNNGHEMEIDVLAYSERKPENEVFLVEVKSHLRQDAIEQMRQMLRSFHKFFPIHAGKKVYGMLAAVDAPEKIREKVLAEGIYLARIHDGQFDLQVPEDFQPRAF